MDISAWVLLHYSLPPQPTATRVYVWRKLKRLGAIFWQEAVWVLPDTARTREHFQWLAAEIVEMDGKASLWESRLLQADQEQALAQQFSEQTDAAYRAILIELKKRRPNLAKLAQQFQQAAQSDYFHSPLARQVRDTLTSARGSPPGGKNK